MRPAYASLYYRRSVVSLKDNPDRERIVSAIPVDDDSSFELKLRPQRLREFIGQKKVKDNLEVAIQAAKSRGEALDHVLLYGPPGLGTTTLANIIANELGVPFQQTSGPTLQIKGDLTAIRTAHGVLEAARRILASPWFMCGLFFMAVAFFSLLITLSWAESVVGPASASLTFIANAFAARLFLGERVDHRRWLAALLGTSGVALLAQ